MCEERNGSLQIRFIHQPCPGAYGWHEADVLDLQAGVAFPAPAADVAPVRVVARGRRRAERDDAPHPLSLAHTAL